MPTTYKDYIVKSGGLKRIHVKRLNIQRNKSGAYHEAPCWLIQVKGGRFLCYSWKFVGSVLDPHASVTGCKYAPKPLACGARIWIETYGALVLYGVTDISQRISEDTYEELVI